VKEKTRLLLTALGACALLGTALGAEKKKKPVRVRPTTFTVKSSKDGA